MSSPPARTGGQSTPTRTCRSGQPSSPKPASRTPARTQCGTPPRLSPWRRASPWPSLEMLGNPDVRATRAYTHVVTAGPGRGGQLGRALFGKTATRAMIINTLLAFRLVRWSRLSESNR